MGYQVPTYIIIKENKFYYVLSHSIRKGPYRTKHGARKGLWEMIINGQDPIIIERYDEKGRLLNK